MNYLIANWQTVAVAVLAIAEVFSLFIKGNGTLAGIIGFVKGLPGVKDPNVGQ